jgi:hypothetical protein
LCNNLLIVLALTFGTLLYTSIDGAAAEAGFPSDWGHHADLVVPVENVPDGGVRRFTVVLTEAGLPDVWAEAQPDARDLRASEDAAGYSPLGLDVIAWDADAKTCQVAIGPIDLSDVEPARIRIWWGNSNASAADGSAAYGDKWIAYLPNVAGRDRTGNGNDGILHGDGADPLVVPGVLGAGLEFQGPSGSCVNLGDGLLATPIPEITVSVWARPDEADADRGVFGTTDGAPTDDYPVSLRTDAEGFLSGLARGWKYNGDGVSYESTGGALTAAQWHHLALRIGSESSLYIDGKPNAASASVASRAPLADPLPFYVGSGSKSRFKGGIDEAAIWSGVASEAWIRTWRRMTSAPASFVQPAHFGPSAHISSIDARQTMSSPIPVTIEWSEPVYGFTASDVLVDDAQARNFSRQSDQVYTLELIPQERGSVHVDLAPGVCANADGEGNAPADWCINYYPPREQSFPAPEPSFPGAWLHYADISVAATGAGPVDDFTCILTQASLPAFWAEAQEDGGDLRASLDASGLVPLGIDIIEWDAAAKTCQIAIGPLTLNGSSSTELRLWWGEANADAPDGSQAYGPSWIAYLPRAAGADRTGNGHDGMSWGSGAPPAVIGGAVGQASFFSGASGQCVALGPGVADWPVQPMTVSVWARPDDVSRDGGVFGTVDGASTDGYPVSLRADAKGFLSGLPRAWKYNGDGTAHESAGEMLQEGSWHHLALSIGDDTALYVDGVREAPSASEASSDLTTDSPDFFVGTGSKERFYGAIDEVAVWSGEVAQGWLEAWHMMTAEPAAFAWTEAAVNSHRTVASSGFRKSRADSGAAERTEPTESPSSTAVPSASAWGMAALAMTLSAAARRSMRQKVQKSK